MCFANVAGTKLGFERLGKAKVGASMYSEFIVPRGRHLLSAWIIPINEEHKESAVRSSDLLQHGGPGRLWGVVCSFILSWARQKMYGIYPLTNQQWPDVGLSSFEAVLEGV